MAASYQLNTAAAACNAAGRPAGEINPPTLRLPDPRVAPNREAVEVKRHTAALACVSLERGVVLTQLSPRTPCCDHLHFSCRREIYNHQRHELLLHLSIGPLQTYSDRALSSKNSLPSYESTFASVKVSLERGTREGRCGSKRGSPVA